MEGDTLKDNEEIELLDEVPKKEHKSKRKIKKWVYLLFIIFILGSGFIGYKIMDNNRQEKLLQEEKKKKEKLEEIKSHYNSSVKTIKKTKLYQKDNNEYIEKGLVYQDTYLNLYDMEITLDTKYFQIKDLDYYVEYDSVLKDEELLKDGRYKNYLPFNENIITKDEFTLYRDDKEMYTFYLSMEFPIIIKNYDDKYYVEFDDMLLNIHKDDIKEIIKKENTKKKNQSKITTLAYHRVYDINEKCTDGYICIKKSSFDQEMKYLKDNNYLTLTMEEMYMYLKGNLQVEKAVTLTFDDGYLYKSANDVLEKYQLNGTMFVISSHFNDLTQFKNISSLAIQSHTDNMHRNYVCSGGNQGGAILCASKEEIKNDLTKSLEKLQVEPFALAFPFYDYNDKAISVLKSLGFKMSFIGRAGQMGKATPNKTDLYKIPRMTVWEQSLMSFNTWKSYL